MNYLSQALKGDEDKPGRQKGRMSAPATEQVETGTEDSFIIGPVPGIEQPTEPAATPAEPVNSQGQPAEEPKPKSAPKTKPDKKSGNETSKKVKKSDSEDEAEPDKDKYSIYLPKKLSMTLRMVYILTRKKYSRLVESALTDMFYHRYQCENPACNACFSMSEHEKLHAPRQIPARCPACGGEKIYLLREDVPD